MRAVMLMFDALNRHMLSAYGCDWTHTPNFQRLANHACRFDRAFVGSMGCLAARRELHTGQYNFLHRSDGPLEPFDDSMPEILSKHNVYSHLITDHCLYWTETTSSFPQSYSTYEFFRGQGGDPWKSNLRAPLNFQDPNPSRSSSHHRTFHDRPYQDWCNRAKINASDSLPQTRIFEKGIEFIRENLGSDRWFLHLDSFDPKPPFFVPEHFKSFYEYDFDRFRGDWPSSGKISSPELAHHHKMLYAALLSLCDSNLGKILDLFDLHDLWRNTMLIVNTDHGFLLGEHDFCGDTAVPLYNEVAHIPLFIWDPRARVAGKSRNALVQTIDIAPTILDFFDLPVPAGVRGKSLQKTILEDAVVREGAIFGEFGFEINATDGRFITMRPGKTDASDTAAFEYTLSAPRHQNSSSLEPLHAVRLVSPLPFSKQCNLLQIPFPLPPPTIPDSLLFDMFEDPSQQNPLPHHPGESEMASLLGRLMARNYAPPEQFARIGLLPRAEDSGVETP